MIFTGFKKIIEVFFLIIEHKLVIIGLDNAGKTTILYQLYVTLDLIFKKI